MPVILACVDASRYAPAVCDHASWFAGRMQAEIVVLNVVEDAGAPDRPRQRRARSGLLEEAAERLAHEGAPAARPLELPGVFPDTAMELVASSDVVVLGKRGTRTEQNRRRLGGAIGPIVRTSQRPICLVSQVFLPITRALVLLDADPGHRRTTDLVAAHPALEDLDIDVVLMSDGAPGAAHKLEWARSRLGASGAEVFSLATQRPDQAASLYMQSRGSDLLIMSREVALAGLGIEQSMGDFADESLWAWRTPVLIC
jgi:nucleotide-binding universal stress UspA family protein